MDLFLIILSLIAVVIGMVIADASKWMVRSSAKKKLFAIFAGVSLIAVGLLSAGRILGVF